RSRASGMPRPAKPARHTWHARVTRIEMPIDCVVTRRVRSPECTAELACEELDRAARAAGELGAPLAVGVEARVADELAPGSDDARDGARVGRVARLVAYGAQHVGDDAEEGAQRHGGLDAVLPADPRFREHGRNLLEVVQEEARRELAEARRLA